MADWLTTKKQNSDWFPEQSEFCNTNQQDRPLRKLLRFQNVACAKEINFFVSRKLFSAVKLSRKRPKTCKFVLNFSARHPPKIDALIYELF